MTFKIRFIVFIFILRNIYVLLAQNKKALIKTHHIYASPKAQKKCEKLFVLFFYN